MGTGLARAAAVAVAAAVVFAVPGAAHASPVRAAHVSVRLWRHVVHEPGTLGLTFTDTRDVRDVYAVATSASGNDVAVSGMVRQRGHVFTLRLRFPHGVKTGTWYLAGVWATPAGAKPDPYAPPVTWAVPEFKVRS